MNADSNIQRLKELKETLARMPQRTEQDFFASTWKALVGDRLDEFLESEAKAKEHLHSPSWQMRLAAISILCHHYGVRGELAPILEKMAFQDEHPQVRATAIFRLAWCFGGTGDQRIGELLADVVTDKCLDRAFRGAAYQGLLELTGRSGLNRPLPGTYRFPEDIDYTLIQRFRPETP